MPLCRPYSLRTWLEHWNQSGWESGIWFPFTISQRPWWRDEHWVSVIFLHIQEWWGLGWYYLKEQAGKYFFLKVLVRSELGLFWCIQYCFAIIAWLKKLKFLNPRPPYLFGLHSLPQLTKWSFLVPGSCPDQKDLTMVSNFLHTESWTLKHENV